MESGLRGRPRRLVYVERPDSAVVDAELAAAPRCHRPRWRCGGGGHWSVHPRRIRPVPTSNSGYCSKPVDGSPQVLGVSGILDNFLSPDVSDIV